MFTGIVERTVRVLGVEDRPGRRIITVEVRPTDPFPSWEPAVIGESISVSGVCLTVVGARPAGRGEAVSFDAVPETLARTTIGGLRAGDTVNIERSLRAGDRFGGHYVTGHVDGVGTLRSRRAQGDQVLFEVEAPGIIRMVIPKGSIAVEGISLTVVDVDREAGCFRFAVIPHTLAWTNLKEKGVGSAVNLETDAFGKWVFHALEVGSTTGVDDAGADDPGKLGWEPGGKQGADDRLRRLLDQEGSLTEGRGP